MLPETTLPEHSRAFSFLSPKQAERLAVYLQLMRADKPIGTLLLLWPTLWALWMATDGLPDFGILFAFVLGTFLMRSAGCVVNDFADRNFDGAVARTKNCPFATGKMSTRKALLLVLALCGSCRLYLQAMPHVVCAADATTGCAIHARWPYWFALIYVMWHQCGQYRAIRSRNWEACFKASLIQQPNQLSFVAWFAGTLQWRLKDCLKTWPPGTKLPFGGSTGTIPTLNVFLCERSNHEPNRQYPALIAYCAGFGSEQQKTPV
ncbi:4-hydroxybenzoate octaprenyltransferase [Helicobacter pametensis]|nr:4-hydroxybenzoate octaprenyltransferase [Helicobacter pametensis]